MTFSSDCFICDKYVLSHGVSLQIGQTTFSKTKLPLKINQLVGDDFMVVVAEDDKICADCFSLINNVDKLEEELLLAKKDIIKFLRLKYQLATDEVLIIDSIQEPKELNESPDDANTSNVPPHSENSEESNLLEVNVLCAKPDKTLSPSSECCVKPKYPSPICDSVQKYSAKIHGTHKCCICGETFQSQVCIRRHIMYSHLKWTCSYCSIHFDKKDMYNSHMKIHVNEISSKCNLKSNKSLSTHFHCINCNFKTSEKHMFDNHVCCNLLKGKICELTCPLRNAFKKHEYSDKISRSTFKKLDHNPEIVTESTSVSVNNYRKYVNNKSCTMILHSENIQQEVQEATFEGLDNSEKLNLNKLPLDVCKPYDNDNKLVTQTNVVSKSGEKELEYTIESECRVNNNHSKDFVCDIIETQENGFEGHLSPKCKIHHIKTFSKIFQKSSSREINCDLFHHEKTLNFNRTTENKDEFKYRIDNMSLETGKTVLNKENEINNFVCKICTFNFLSENELKNHFKTCHEDIMTTCPICLNHFVSVDEMHLHLQMFHGCIKIENEIKLKTNLEETKNEIESLNVYKQCDKILSANKILKKNLKVNLGDGRIECGLCKMEFRTEKCLENHVLNFHRDRTCRFCGEKLGNLKTLKKHEQQHLKNNEFKLQCSKCEKSFKTKGGLKCHLAIHTGNFKYCCDFCGRGFMSRMALEEHRSTHTKEKRFMCDVCGKTFCAQSTYWIHRKWHDNPYPYKCNYCNRCYKHSSVLAVHKRTHTGYRPYKCPHCPLCFSISNTLKRHIILHTQEYPYNCKPCQRGFTTRNKYAKHLSKIHSNSELMNESSKPRDFKMAINNELVHVGDDHDSGTWEPLLPPFNLSLASDIVSSDIEDIDGQILQVFL